MRSGVLPLLAHERVGFFGDRVVGELRLRSVIIWTIIFSNPTARNETALAMLENAGFSGFHRNGTS